MKDFFKAFLFITFFNLFVYALMYFTHENYTDIAVLVLIGIAAGQVTDGKRQ